VLVLHPALAPYRVDSFNALSRRTALRLVFLEENVAYQAFDQARLRALLEVEPGYLLSGINVGKRTIRLGNRLVGLGRRLNTYIEFRNVHEDYREHREAFLLADDVALLYRINHTRWEGIADTCEPAVARRYLSLFDEIWAASENSRELRQLRV